MNVPDRDVQFGKIVRWLQKHGLEMHTPIRGETYVCKRKPKPHRKSFDDIRERE